MFKWLKDLFKNFGKKKDTDDRLSELREILTSVDSTPYPTNICSPNILCVTLNETPPFGTDVTDGKEHPDSGIKLNSELLYSPPLTSLVPTFDPSWGTHISPDDAAFLRKFNKPKKKAKKSKKNPVKKKKSKKSK